MIPDILWGREGSASIPDVSPRCQFLFSLHNRQVSWLHHCACSTIWAASRAPPITQPVVTIHPRLPHHLQPCCLHLRLQACPPPLLTLQPYPSPRHPGSHQSLWMTCFTSIMHLETAFSIPTTYFGQYFTTNLAAVRANCGSRHFRATN